MFHSSVRRCPLFSHYPSPTHFSCCASFGGKGTGPSTRLIKDKSVESAHKSVIGHVSHDGSCFHYLIRAELAQLSNHACRNKHKKNKLRNQLTCTNKLVHCCSLVPCDNFHWLHRPILDRNHCGELQEDRKARGKGGKTATCLDFKWAGLLSVVDMGHEFWRRSNKSRCDNGSEGKLLETMTKNDGVSSGWWEDKKTNEDGRVAGRDPPGQAPPHLLRPPQREWVGRASWFLREFGKLSGNCLKESKQEWRELCSEIKRREVYGGNERWLAAAEALIKGVSEVLFVFHASV